MALNRVCQLWSKDFSSEPFFHKLELFRSHHENNWRTKWQTASHSWFDSILLCRSCSARGDRERNTTLQFHPVSVYMWNMYSEWQVKRLMFHSSNTPNVKHPETTTWLISSFWGQQYHFWTETSCISVAMLLAWRVGLDTLGCIWVQPSCYHK